MWTSMREKRVGRGPFLIPGGPFCLLALETNKPRHVNPPLPAHTDIAP